MTARRLRRENKPDVKRFLYVPLPVFVAHFVGLWTAAVAAERRDSPQIAANRRNAATLRILSQSVVIGRLENFWQRCEKKVEFYRPDTPSPFPLLVEGLFADSRVS
jgi:hypothetical protein